MAQEGYGRWPDCSEGIIADGRSRKERDLRRFSEEMQSGDIVLLRLGTKDVYAVGEIVGGYDWSEEFGDIDGWDLQHIRRVRWIWKGLKTFETYGLRQGDTTQKLASGNVKDWLRSLTVDVRARELALLPPDTYAPVTIIDVSQSLYDAGVASYSIDRLTSEINDLVRTAKWYQKFAASPSEHETVCYLVVPLLRALGWTPQRMGVEWKNIDVALFQTLPRNNENLSAVIEAKRMDQSCLMAIEQANGYTIGRQSCATVVVTDGIRYAVYLRDGAACKMYAYLNLMRLTETCAVYRCKGATAALLAMTPEWLGRVSES